MLFLAVAFVGGVVAEVCNPDCSDYKHFAFGGGLHAANSAAGLSRHDQLHTIHLAHDQILAAIPCNAGRQRIYLHRSKSHLQSHCMLKYAVCISEKSIHFS